MSLNTFDRAKAAQGFVPAGARPSCSNCLRVEKHEAQWRGQGGMSWRCMKGGFYVNALAICNEHKPATQVRDTNTKEMFS
ncbi:MAG: hypothetical protein Q8N06_06825 [Hydrogenophaga sp.]|nr:hypothetical protein [Hydrogenophaga sp.]